MEWKMSDMMEHEEKNTEQRISDPFSWDGHETEAMLACESGNGTAKELVAVVRVRAEGRPEAFYRVKEAGQKNADFESWLEAVDYYNCIEEEKRPEAPDTGIAKVEITDEDWKTAIAQHKQPIPAGAKVKITGITAPIKPITIPSIINGVLINQFAAPTLRIIAISSLRA